MSRANSAPKLTALVSWPYEKPPASYGVVISDWSATPYAIALCYPASAYVGVKTNVQSDMQWLKAS